MLSVVGLATAIAWLGVGRAAAQPGASIALSQSSNVSETTGLGAAHVVRRWVPPLYPIAFPVAYIINVWATAQVHPATMYRSIFLAAVMGLAVSALATVLLGRARGALVTSAVLVALIAPPDSTAGPALLGIAFLICVEALVHRRRPLTHANLFNRVLAATAVIALLATGIRLVNSGALGNAIEDVQLDLESRGPVDPPPERPPDIVFVMLDGFPGDRAAELAGQARSTYDADALPNALTNLGFDVQRNSHSNYLLTPLTLASVFSMRQLDELPSLRSDDAPRAVERALRRQINQGAALDLLHRAGYELVWVDAGFAATEVRRVDRWINSGTPNEFEIALLSSINLGDLIMGVAPDLLSDLHRQQVHETLDELDVLATEPHDQPRFTFVHVPSPHAPWIFGPNGEPRREGIRTFFADPIGKRTIDREEAVRRVFDQSSYLGDQVARALDPIVSQEHPPVIVVFSDHGPGTGFNFLDPEHSDVTERSSNFLATFTPAKPDLFARFTTPVNLFPTILNGYLGTDVARQPDTVHSWSGSILDLTDVPPPVASPASR
jgi:hypothetical protein